MSPLQFQKQLRLQEARNLLLTEAVDAATAGHRVGYESPSQFSREYSRLFGVPPATDMRRLRATRCPGAAAASAPLGIAIVSPAQFNIDHYEKARRPRAARRARQAPRPAALLRPRAGPGRGHARSSGRRVTRGRRSATSPRRWASIRPASTLRSATRSNFSSKRRTAITRSRGNDLVPLRRSLPRAERHRIAPHLHGLASPAEASHPSPRGCMMMILAASDERRTPRPQLQKGHRRQAHRARATG